MKRLLYIIMCACMACQMRAQVQMTDSVFAKVPREVLPVLDRTAKLDLLDLYNCKLPAKAENSYGGQSELLLKTADFLVLRTSEVGTWQMKLLDTPHDTLVMVVWCLQAGGLHCEAEVYDLQWRTYRHAALPQPQFEALFVPSPDLSDDRNQVLAAVLRQVPVVMKWDDAGKQLVCRLGLDGLSVEDRADAEGCARALHYEWKKGMFCRVGSEK
ncbi:MAG: DUF3256 family protein [Alloprevotella sp.]